VWIAALFVALPAWAAGPLFPGPKFHAGNSPFAVAIGDLNGDSVPDLAVSNSSGDNVSVLLGAGDGMPLHNDDSTYDMVIEAAHFPPTRMRLHRHHR